MSHNEIQNAKVTQLYSDKQILHYAVTIYHVLHTLSLPGTKKEVQGDPNTGFQV